jgi:hypothetical protein
VCDRKSCKYKLLAHAKYPLGSKILAMNLFLKLNKIMIILNGWSSFEILSK